MSWPLSLCMALHSLKVAPIRELEPFYQLVQQKVLDVIGNHPLVIRAASPISIADWDTIPDKTLHVVLCIPITCDGIIGSPTKSSSMMIKHHVDNFLGTWPCHLCTSNVWPSIASVEVWTSRSSGWSKLRYSLGLSLFGLSFLVCSRFTCTSPSDVAP